MRLCSVSELVGKVFHTVTVDADLMSVSFIAGDYAFQLFHKQDCCESVLVEDIVGELSDLEGSVILSAEEVTSDVHPDGVVKREVDSFTWTFYKFSTFKGSVTIRFFGQSNGYYSESVDCWQL